MDENNNHTPSLGLSLGIIVGLLVWMLTGVLLMGIEIRILLFIAIVAVSLICHFAYGFTSGKMIKDMEKSVANGVWGLFFFIIIGMAIAVWMISGSLPAIVYYGLKLLTPKIFLPMTFVLSSIFSICTGSAWTTAATIGIVCFGIGLPLGIPEPLIVGAVVSGAYFGDKMSPVSDSTNLAPLSSGTDVFTHIRAMLYVTAPAYVVAFIMYMVLGMRFDSSGVDISGVVELENAITSVFNVNILVLAPIILVLILSLMKKQAIPTMACGILAAIPIAVIFQGQSLGVILNSMASGVSLDIENAMVAKIVNRGGIGSMLETMSIAVIALAFGGLMSGTGIFPTIIGALVKAVKNPRLYPMITILTCMFLILTTGDNYVPLTLVGQLYGDAYDNMGLDRSMLSRNIEEGGTISAVLCPWASSAAYYAGVFGVATMAYLPYAYLNIITIILGCALPLFGLTIITKGKVDGWNKDKKAAKA